MPLFLRSTTLNYIVIDLEWNQKIHRGSMRALGEIIEIGAVMMNEDMEILDELCIVVRPSVYNGMHPHVKKIVHLDEETLANGVLFEDAAKQLRDFCGEEFCFLSWGDEDASILMENLAYYGLELDFASYHYDMQRIYRQQKETEPGQNQRALAWCVEALGIEAQEGEYHSALTDARYAAQILKHLDMERAARDNSGRYYPNSRQIQSHFAKFRTHVQQGQGLPTCKFCGKPSRVILDMFSFTGNSMIVIAHCKDHGYFSSIFSRKRVRKKNPNALRGTASKQNKKQD